MAEWLIEAAPWLDVIGWALLHSLWQAALTALLFASLSRALKRAPAGLRVVLGEAALLGCLLLPALTAVSLPWVGPAAPIAVTLGEGLWSPPTQGAAEAGRELPLTAMLAAVWALGVALLALRAALRWQRLRRIVAEAQPVAAPWQRQLGRLRQRFGVVRPVRWLESAEIAAPMLVGWLRPVVLFPLGMTVGLAPRHIELLLAHELAHVRRADFLFNLLQLLVETLLFFNPAVRWLSARVRHERELACDEYVAAEPADRSAYARALLAVAEHRLRHGELALAATGGVLLERVRRIVGEEAPDARDGGLRALLVASALALLFGFGLRMAQPALEAIPPLPIERLLGQSLRAVGVEPLRLPAPDFDAAELAALRPLPASVEEPVAILAPLPVFMPDLRRSREAPAAALAAPDLSLALALPEPLPRVEEADSAVRPLHYRAPDYPRAARLAGVEGWIELAYRIDAGGRPRDIEVLGAEALAAFEAASREALARWRFPIEAAGQRRQQRFDFSLDAAKVDDEAEAAERCLRPATGSRVCRRGPVLADPGLLRADAAALRR